MFGYIYKTTCLVNNKIYVGKHVSSSLDESYKGSGKILLRAFRKYGKENFDCVLLEAVDTEEELNAREKYWIAKLSARDHSIGYNINEGGEGNPGYKHTDETKALLSEKKRKYKWYHKGDYYTTFPTDANIPEGFIPGKPPITLETKEKIANTLKSKNLKAYKSNLDKKTIYLSPEDEIPEGYVPGRYLDLEYEATWKEKLRQASTGQTHICSEEQKERNRQAQLGTKCYTDGKITVKLKPDEEVPAGFYPGIVITDAIVDARKVISEKLKGHVCSEYTKERSRQAHLGVTPVNAKKVFCEDTNTLYTSISSASKDTTVPASYIQKALKIQDKVVVKYKGKQYTFEVHYE